MHGDKESQRARAEKCARDLMGDRVSPGMVKAMAALVESVERPYTKDEPKGKGPVVAVDARSVLAKKPKKGKPSGQEVLW